MKKKNFINIFCLTTLFLCACNEGDFLEVTNPNAITTSTFWQSEAQFNSALTTVYSALQFTSVSGGEVIYDMALGDEGGTESWYRPTAFRNLTYNDNTYHVTDKWAQLYIGIFRANQVIQNLETAERDEFNDDRDVTIEAEARFLRGFFYFQLVHSYGGAVMHTRVAETDEDLAKPFSSIEEVTNTIIIPDLEFARANLPQTWPSSQTGRATWGAATSMLGKIHLFDENWAGAAALFKEVIDSGVYALTADIMDNWRHDTEYNEESIFEVAFSDELSPGVNGDFVDDTPWGPGSEASSMATELGQLNFGAFNTILPSYYMHEMFVNEPLDPNSPLNSEENVHSARMSATICPRDAETLFYGLAVGERGGWGFGQSAYVKKYTNWYHKPSEDTNRRSGINFRHIRLADVYLMYAEAVLNASGDVDTAIEYIDKIRSRSGVKTLVQLMDEFGGKFPQLHVSIQVHGSQPTVSPTAENVMTHLRRVERPLELCFEGHRYKDLVRWGIVKEVFDELRQDEIWREQNKDGVLDIGNNGVAPLFIVERIRPDFFLSAQNYSPEQHNYFPIPTQERQTNPLIE